MGWLHASFLIVGGALAVVAFVAKTPEAKALQGKLAPVRAFVGAGLLVFGVMRLMQIGPINAFRTVEVLPLMGLTNVGASYVSIFLGLLCGVPPIVAASESNTELAKKLGRFQMIFGILCLATGVLVLLFELRVLRPM